jgi:hypothetical protein
MRNNVSANIISIYIPKVVWDQYRQTCYYKDMGSLAYNITSYIYIYKLIHAYDYNIDIMRHAATSSSQQIEQRMPNVPCGTVYKYYSLS